VSFDASPHLAGLKSFQRATVDHVAKRFYEDSARRFLVADETGLGKSLVGRGVIARAIEHLQHLDECRRIDIVYVCSNTDIAEQNLKRLDVLGTGSSHHATRLTLLAQQTHELAGDPHPEVGKRVNLVSFTPGTSFDLGHSTGRAEERALLHVILCQDLGYRDRVTRKAAAVVLRATSGLSSFQWQIDSMHRRLDGHPPDPAITTPFCQTIRDTGLRRRFNRAVKDRGRRTNITDAEREEYRAIVGELRGALAGAGVDALEPDLIILDEFQRFRHLLSLDDPRHRDAAELAHALFAHGDAKVLLLSATPYKPFTYAEEVAAGDDHAADLRRTLGFLADGSEATVNAIAGDLAAYRRAAIDGAPTRTLRIRLETALTDLMSRTERPRLGDDGMLEEVIHAAAPVPAADIVDYAALRRLADALPAPIAVDYWKSTPYFANFGDGYRFGDQLRDALTDPARRTEIKTLLRGLQLLDGDDVRELRPLDPGNARLRHLIGSTIDQDWWKLLWIPPSAPYDPPDGPFDSPAAQGITKRLIFSSWTAAPTAIAAISSHEAYQRIAGTRAALDGTNPRLDWRTDRGRPAAMTTLALFWPSPVLAARTPPFQPAPKTVQAPGRATGAEPWYWTTLFAESGSAPDTLAATSAASALAGESEDQGEEHSRLRLHAELALALASGADDGESERRTGSPDDLAQVLALVGRYGPGNISYRCIDRLTTPDDPVTDDGRWRAAAILAGGLRSLFNRPESILLLDQLVPDTVYWRAVLQYCAWGNLEAVLDEYLYHLSETDRFTGLDDERLAALAMDARTAITPRPSRYEVFDPQDPERRIAFPSRFALRYGNKRASFEESTRLPEVRAAFNSPFWPFILATTSVGQEGIDFHWWCHAAVHWNTPASPVDFEQREGRVNRYGGHAIRRNLAARHRAEMLEAGRTGEHPWDAAYSAGARDATDRHQELAPHWINDGETKVERHLLLYPLSRDHERYRRLKEDLAVYRLTFGQPRQEDLADLLKQRGVHLDPTEVEALKLDLRPPRPDDRDRLDIRGTETA